MCLNFMVKNVKTLTTLQDFMIIRICDKLFVPVYFIYHMYSVFQDNSDKAFEAFSGEGQSLRRKSRK